MYLRLPTKLDVVCKICVAEHSSYTLLGVTRNSCDVTVRLICDMRLISKGQKAAQTFFFSHECISIITV